MTEKRLAWQGGKCRVPQFWGFGSPAGFCDEQSFGEQLPEAILVHERGFAPYAAQYGRRIPYCGVGPCCPNHGGPKEGEPRFFQDGWTNEGRPMWCCVGPDFENLQESPAGFDGNPFVARKQFLAAQGIEAQRAETTQIGSVADESPVPQGCAQTQSSTPDNKDKQDG